MPSNSLLHYLSSISTHIDDATTWVTRRQEIIDPVQGFEQHIPIRRERHSDGVLEIQAQLQTELEELSVIENKVSNLRKELETQCTRFKTRMTPIYTLPPELLSMIFVHVVRNHSSYTSLGRALLMRVSRDWKNHVMRQPSLWTYQKFSSRPGLAFAPNFLSLIRERFKPSGTLPLTLQIDLGNDHPTYRDALSEWDGHWASRIQDLLLSGHGGACALFMRKIQEVVHQGRLPLLARLHIVGYPENACGICRRWSAPISIPAENCPSLHEFEIEWHTSFSNQQRADFSRLTKISLRNMSGVDWFSLRAMLENAVMVKDLALSSFETLGSALNGSHSAQITLPSLQSLYIVSRSPWLVSHLVKDIRAPALERLVLDLRWRDHDQLTLMQSELAHPSLSPGSDWRNLVRLHSSLSYPLSLIVRFCVFQS